jgi:bifunctional non-homologous end joining protein LigD
MKDRKIEIEKSAYLEYVDYAKNSDKVYNLRLLEHPSGEGFEVITTYGRRHGSRTTLNKTDGPVPYSNASKVYSKLLEQKMAKGYVKAD